jgi:hypothetical protein
MSIFILTNCIQVEFKSTFEASAKLRTMNGTKVLYKT